MIFWAIALPLFLLSSLSQGSALREANSPQLRPRSSPSSSSPSLFQLHLRLADAMPLGSIPPECQASCQPFLDISNTCALSSSQINVTCICSDASANSILQCVDCIANSSMGPIFAAEEQPKLDNFTAACQEAGHPFNETLQVTPGQANSVALGAFSLSISQLTSLVFILVYLMRI